MQSKRGLGMTASQYFLNFIGSSDEQRVIVSMNKGKKKGKVHFGAFHTYRPSKSYRKPSKIPGGVRSWNTCFPVIHQLCVHSPSTAHSQPWTFLHLQGLSVVLASSLYTKYVAKLGKKSKFHLGSDWRFTASRNGGVKCCVSVSWATQQLLLSAAGVNCPGKHNHAFYCCVNCQC